MSLPPAAARPAVALMALAFAIALAITLLAGCGKKGPPRLPSMERPAAPQCLSALRRAGEIRLLWTHPAAGTAIGYQVMRASAGADPSPLMRVTLAEYTDAAIKPDVSYSYVVHAVGEGGVWGKPSQEITVEGEDSTPAPPPPSDVRIRLTASGVEISWIPPTEDGGAVSYNVYRREEGSAPGPLPINAAPILGASINDAFAPQKALHYSVRTGVVEGRVHYEGPSSLDASIGPADYLVSRPGGLDAVLTDGGVVVLWEAVAEPWATGYAIYRSIGATGSEEFTRIGEPRVAGFTDADLSPGVRRYRVAAVGPAGEGEPSGTLEVTLPAR